MQKTISIRIPAADAAKDSAIRQNVADTAGIKSADITGYYITKRSIDARSRQAWVNLSLVVFVNEPFTHRPKAQFQFKDVSNVRRSVLIIGAGPTGLFAALRLLEHGIKPILIERGKDVRSRRRDLAMLNKQGEVNTESNYCFGEGGAGTYSDGKLYTRSSKRGDVNKILNLFVHFGAEENILFDAHPHIGTNKLPQIITAMRQMIIDCGGEFHFEKKLSSIDINNGQVVSVKTADGHTLKADAYILATGHSARDIFHLLHEKKILIESKPFALGVRVEHPQALIDNVQYHLGGPAIADKGSLRPAYLPPASYSVVQQVEGKGVFSFCMCPGGIIAPAATSPGELVVNGWSPSKRNNPYANSGIVVTVEPGDIRSYAKYGPLAAMKFQEDVERKAFAAGGGKFVAPAQRLIDFTENKLSSSLPDCSYLPGISPVKLSSVLPAFINNRLRQAFIEFGKKMPLRPGKNGYLTNDAVVVATESRTSSPVRIPRDSKTLVHPQLSNLYPAGEGAGYAGGIVSAAMDGERIAERIALTV